jgi:hypothetical protein
MQETGAVYLTDEGRKIVLAEWQERKKTDRRHPFLDEVWTRALSASAIAGPASARRSRRLSALVLEMKNRDVGTRDL